MDILFKRTANHSLTAGFHYAKLLTYPGIGENDAVSEFFLQAMNLQMLRDNFDMTN